MNFQAKQLVYQCDNHSNNSNTKSSRLGVKTSPRLNGQQIFLALAIRIKYRHSNTNTHEICYLLFCSTRNSRTHMYCRIIVEERQMPQRGFHTNFWFRHCIINNWLAVQAKIKKVGMTYQLSILKGMVKSRHRVLKCYLHKKGADCKYSAPFLIRTLWKLARSYLNMISKFKL